MTDGNDFISTGREFIRDTKSVESRLVSSFDALFSQQFVPMNQSMLQKSLFIQTIVNSDLQEYKVILEDLYSNPGGTYNVSDIIGLKMKLT